MYVSHFCEDSLPQRYTMMVFFGGFKLQRSKRYRDHCWLSMGSSFTRLQATQMSTILPSS